LGAVPNTQGIGAIDTGDRIQQAIGSELAGVFLGIDCDLGVMIDAGEFDVTNLVQIVS
jgi:hypothetical protein